MKKINWPQFWVILSIAATIIVNALANILPINGQNTGEISDRFSVFFVPAGYVFSIWGVIYLGLIAFAVFQALPAQQNNPRINAARGAVIFSGAANIAWIFLWHYEVFAGTLVAMGALLVSLIVIYLKLEIGRTAVSRAEHWSARVPFSIYLGWVSVATIANVSSVLNFYRWNGGPIAPEIWTIIMLATGVVLGVAMQLRHRDFAYGWVLVWAFAGIAIKHAATPTVSVSAWIATVLVFLLLVWGKFLRQPQISNFPEPAI